MYLAVVVVKGESFYRAKIPDKDEFFWTREKKSAYKYISPVKAIIAAINSLPDEMMEDVAFEKLK